MSRILIVEDNGANQELLRDWLEAEGYEVVEATNLAAARAILAGETPQAVLLDVELRGENGLALVAWMRTQPALVHVPVIAVTAHAMLTEQASILQAGCNAWVPKPVDFRALRQHLRRWLSRPAAEAATGPASENG
jgi:two-component system cell cycle response regulator DivK